MWPFPLLCIVLSSVRGFSRCEQLEKKNIVKTNCYIISSLFFYFLMAIFDLDNDSLKHFINRVDIHIGRGICVHNTSHQHLLCILTLDLVPSCSSVPWLSYCLLTNSTYYVSDEVSRLNKWGWLWCSIFRPQSYHP